MPYFTYSRGLRGCYMPEDVQEIRVQTRRELGAFMRDEIKWLFEDVGDGEKPRGLSKRAVASYVAEVWRRRDSLGLPLALPYGDGSHALFLSTSCRADYIARRKAEGADHG